MKEEKLHDRYVTMFKSCINKKKPLTVEEIISFLEKDFKMNKKDFSKNYLPKLRKLGLILIIEGTRYNRKNLRMFGMKDLNKKTSKNYYFFTIQSSEIKKLISRILNKLKPNLKNYNEIIDKASPLMNNLMEYELLINFKPKYAGFKLIEEFEEISKRLKTEKKEVKFIKQNSNLLNSPLKSEKAFNRIKRDLKNKIIIIGRENQEEFEELKERINNFLINGDTEISIPKDFPVAGHPILLEKVLEAKYLLFQFTESIKKNIEY
jgi:hypothetical protein